eukprot:SAG25_NODE_7216_length_495_cov_2.287879_2_plen_66_part_01
MVTSALAASAAALLTRDSSVTSHGIAYAPTSCVCGLSVQFVLQPPLVPVCAQEQLGVPGKHEPRS